MRLVKEARQWYKLTSVQAAILLGGLEALRSSTDLDVPGWLMALLIVSIGALRVIQQEGIKRD